MYPGKRNVLLTVALLKAYGVRHIVLSPGSRNAPLIHAFMQDDFFCCQTVVDERNAAFVGLGIIQATNEAVAICCTSGSALLNYAPAVAEAFYQQLPLIVLSADRSPEWINQMDGQTIPQAQVFGSMAKKSVSLPEIYDDSTEWYCKRLCHEALLAATTQPKGPVHINIPLSEPLFDYSVKELPVVNHINHYAPVKSIPMDHYGKLWDQAAKKLLIIGQLPPVSQAFVRSIEQLAEREGCVILAEHLSNIHSPYVFGNFDTLLAAIAPENLQALTPDLLVTMGGHVVSKRVKHWLRNAKPKYHWQVAYQADVIDLYQSLTDLIETDIETFVTSFAERKEWSSDQSYYQAWKAQVDKIDAPDEGTPYSDIQITGRFIHRLPKGTPVHLANSSAIRHAQLFDLPEGVRVYGNRGTNGIDGNLPTTIGFASVTDEPVFLLIGDLSFFYSLSALWNIQSIQNLRILLINNGGGGLFHMVGGLNGSETLSTVSATHREGAEKWAVAAGLRYVKAGDAVELEAALDILMDDRSSGSVLLEAVVDQKIGPTVLQAYYKQQKNRFNGNT